MLDVERIPGECLAQIKRHLHVTWDDDDTDARIIDMMVDAEAALNHKLGATADYFAPGQERQLYRALILYMWNDSADQFDTAYRAEILQVRHKYEVQRQREAEGD